MTSGSPDGTSPQRGGALVRGVVDGGAAPSAGIRRGDLIAALDGRDVGGPAFEAALAGCRPGQIVTVHLVRSTEELDVTVAFPGGDAPTDAPQDAPEQTEG